MMEDEGGAQASNTEEIMVRLDDGTIFYIRAKSLAGESDVSLKAASFDKVFKAIEGVGKGLTEVWRHVGPTKASVELSVEFVWKAGEAVAMFVDNSTTASMKITLEWGDRTSSDKDI
jgi:uncharacterized protein YoxC